ncbi:MAG: AI-2E family transporter [Kofleriaceae bacterium]
MSTSLHNPRDVASWLRVAILLAFAWMVAPIATPVLLGVITAAVLEPVRSRLAPRLGRTLTAGLLTALLVAIALAALVVIGARVAIAFEQLVAVDWGKTSADLRAYVDDGALSRVLGVGGEELRSAVADVFRTLAQGVAATAGKAVVAVPGRVISLFLGSAALYFTLRDGEQMLAWAVARSPFTDDDTRSLLAELRATVRGVVLGLVVTSLVQGALTALALWIFDVPGAFALGAIAMLLSFIPMIGTTPVTLGAVVYLAATGHDAQAVGMAIAAILVGVADNVLRPMVQGRETADQHPLLVLVGIFGGLAVFGVAGVFLGPVLAALAGWAAHHFPIRRQTLRRRAVLEAAADDDAG